MGKRKDLVGARYGRLVVLSSLPAKGGHYSWLCRCDCGVEKPIRAEHLLNGKSQSCGCRQREDVAQWARTHGHCVGRNEGKQVSPEYTTYYSMIWRCYDKKQKYYKNYGGRGIKVCARWRKSFENFFEDMGPRPPGTTLNRIDNDGDYTPKNCNWATREEQMRNSRSVRFIEYAGERRNVSAWAEKLGIPRGIIYRRLWDGWTEKRALSTPYEPR